MSDDTILTDEDGERWSMDRLKHSSYLVGHIAGLEACVLFMQERAVELFREGTHGQAISLQKLAKEMSAKLEEKMRADLDAYEHVFPSRLSPVPAEALQARPLLKLPDPEPEPADEPVLEPASRTEDDDIPF